MKPQNQGQSQNQVNPGTPKQTCKRCFGPHALHECKWTPNACFTCGQVGHKVSECKNPTLKNVFCYNCTQRGHLYSECKERKDEPRNRFGKGKTNARVFALQHEETPTVDTFAGTLLIASVPAYTLIDTGATHSCMTEDFMNTCGLTADVFPDLAMCINTPLGPGSMMTRVVKSVDVVIEKSHMPTDMLVLLMSNFNVILGMN